MGRRGTEDGVKNDEDVKVFLATDEARRASADSEMELEYPRQEEKQGGARKGEKRREDEREDAERDEGRGGAKTNEEKRGGRGRRPQTKDLTAKASHWGRKGTYVTVVSRIFGLERRRGGPEARKSM